MIIRHSLYQHLLKLLSSHCHHMKRSSGRDRFTEGKGEGEPEQCPGTISPAANPSSTALPTEGSNMAAWSRVRKC